MEISTLPQKAFQIIALIHYYYDFSLLEMIECIINPLRNQGLYMKKAQELFVLCWLDVKKEEQKKSIIYLFDNEKLFDVN